MLRGRGTLVIAFVIFGATIARAQTGDENTGTGSTEDARGDGSGTDLTRTVGAVGVVTPPAGGDVVPPTDEEAYREREKQVKEFVDDLLDLPESPAAFALGMTATVIARPGTSREAVATLSAIMAPDGSIVPGVSIEIAPFRLFDGARTIDEWLSRSKSCEIAQSIRLSLATAEGAAAAMEGSPPLIAVGARVAFVDETDYRRNRKATIAVRNALAAAAPKDAPVVPGSATDGGDDPGGIEDFSGQTDVLPDLNDRLVKVYEEMLSGHRLELAGTVVFTSSTQLGAGDGGDFRSGRGWLAYDYTRKAKQFGAAVDASLVRQVDPTSMLEDDRVEVRAGGRTTVQSSRGAFDLDLGYAYLEKAENDDATPHSLLVGTAGTLEIAASTKIKLGLQLACNFEAGNRCDAVVAASLLVGKDETPAMFLAKGIGR